LGSNLGDRYGSINAALKMLGETGGIEVSQVSDIIETRPLGEADQQEYVNAVAELETGLGAEELLKKLHAVETGLGRTRKEKWSSRTIDLDLLLFGREEVNLSHLTVPHPEMQLRSFVLSGLCQLNGELLHPVMKVTVRELAARLNGCDFVRNGGLPQLVSVAGIIGVGKTTLTKKMAAFLGCTHILEAYDRNPFLPDVYAGREELALDSQLFFLTSRLDQSNPRALTAGEIAVGDYVFDKELIYARRLLNARQLSLYEKIHQTLQREVTPPVLVIYLHDSPENCLERIHKRNRPYEQGIGRGFLEELASDYDRLFEDWKVCPLIRLSMSSFDCVRDEDVANLANQVRCYAAE
jgi:2-amino-4-hydroxy-6-hydroxymethyldihydropteridine diphosphokinase